jgi:hypothetical protein
MVDENVSKWTQTILLTAGSAQRRERPMPSLTRLFTAAAAALALAVPAGLAATAASAATGPTIPTKEEAGYQFTGAQFRYAQASVFLRDASQYSGFIGGLGQSVQFWGGGRVYVLGVSDTTSTSPYSPAVAIFNNATHELICSTAGSTPCAGTPASWLNGSVNYPAGHTVQESTFYNTTNGNLTFTVNDLTAVSTSSFTTNIGTGVSFKQVRIGTEFGNDPWSPPATFTAPSVRTKLAVFRNGRLTNYKGTRFGFSGYFTTSPLIMTGPGSVVEADVSGLNSTANGFTTFLEP